MESRKHAFRQSTLTFAAMITLAALTLLLWSSVYLVIRGRQTELAAIARRTDSQNLSDDLARASDLLTRAARRFAVTGNAQHLNAYWNEIKLMRTRELVVDRFREMGTPKDEIVLLALAKSNSDALVATEKRSMRLALEAAEASVSPVPHEVAVYELTPEDRALSREAKRQRAIYILFDDDYDRAKASIMGPIDEFRKKMSAREEAAVEEARHTMRMALIALFTTSGLVFIGMSLVLIVFQLQIASPVMKYTNALQSRKEEDAEFALVPEGTRELHTLADAFNKQWRENQRQLAYNLQLENDKQRHEGILKLNQMRDASVRELLDCALEAASTLTRSSFGYIFFYDEARQLLTRCSVRGKIPDGCSMVSAQSTFRLAELSWLGEAIRQRQPQVIELPSARGDSTGPGEGKDTPCCHLAVPVFSEGRIVMLIGLGGKESAYGQTDQRNVSYLMDLIWKIVARREAESQLKESEARFRSIFEQAAVGISHCSLNGRYLRVNQKFCDVMGYSQEEMLSLTFQEITHPDDLQADLAHVKDLLDGKIRTYSMEKRYVRKGGAPVWVDLTVSLGRDSPDAEEHFIGVIADISLRKKAEEELLKYRNRLEELIEQRTDRLRASEERMRALYRGIPFYTATWQGQGGDLVLVDFNDAAIEMTRGNITRFLGSKASEYYAENPEVLSNMEKCYAEHSTVSIETLYRLKATGEIHHMDFRFTFVPPDLVLVHMNDINERKRAESELRKLSVAVQQSPSSIVITDREGRIQYVNPKFTQVTGYTSEDVIGKNPRILKSGKTPREEYGRLWQEILSGREWRGEFYNRKKNGDLYWELSVVSPIKDDKGDITHFIAIKEDITPRKQMEEALRKGEERLRLLAENASDVIWTMDLSGRFTYVSPSCERLLGYTAEEALQKRFEDFLTPPSLVAAQRYLNEDAARARAGQPVQGGSLELEHIHKDGSTVWAEATFGGMYNDSGEFMGIVGATRDITERRRTEQIRADFVSFATHQLRTPLSGIKWMLELAGEGSATDEDLQSYIHDARASADRLIKLVNDMLDASRIEQGKITVRMVELDLCALTRVTLEELAPMIERKNHQLTFSGCMNPISVSADRDLLRQVILNLTSNAIKYTPPNGVIAVSVSEQDGLVRWEATDNGIGIPRESQANLFQKFFRAENAVIVETEGTGLGLYLVRLIIERLGGHAGCTSEEGKGSTFYFTLPVAR